MVDSLTYLSAYHLQLLTENLLSAQIWSIYKIFSDVSIFLKMPILNINDGSIERDYEWNLFDGESEVDIKNGKIYMDEAPTELLKLTKEEDIDMMHSITYAAE